MLDGLALAGGRALGDGAGDEEDELLGGRPLEVPEMADVGGVGEDHGIRPGRGGGGGVAGTGVLQHEEGSNLHLRSQSGNPRRGEIESSPSALFRSSPMKGITSDL